MQNTSPKPLYPWLALISRSLLFLFFQGLIAIILWIFRQPGAWDESARWWLFSVTPANLVSILFLSHLFRAEGKRFIDLFRFSKSTVWKDLLWMLGTSVIGLPIAALPISNLARLIYGDSMAPVTMMFRPLPDWALAVGILFPLTIAAAELPTYFGYVMPRLAQQLKNGWLAWLIAALFLSIQHCFLPLILDWRFIIWRAGMFLPFALLAGLVLKFRPGLLPYLVIFHGLIDFLTLSTYLMI